MKQIAAAWILLLAALAVHAADSTPDDAMAWLQRITNAAQQLNYSGSFIYQHGQQVETSRITHLKDASGEYEKLVPRLWMATMRPTPVMIPVNMLLFSQGFEAFGQERSLTRHSSAIKTDHAPQHAPVCASRPPPSQPT